LTFRNPSKIWPWPSNLVQDTKQEGASSWALGSVPCSGKHLQDLHRDPSWGWWVICLLNILSIFGIEHIEWKYERYSRCPRRVSHKQKHWGGLCIQNKRNVLSLSCDACLQEVNPTAV
jgi:hypothetical protein